MAKELPKEPTDPRWMPSRNVLIAMAVLLQLAVAGWGIWHYFYGFGDEEHTALLVAQVMTPEDMVYPDTEVGITRGEKLPPIDMADAVRVTPNALREGKQLYEQNCASCHGQEGRGNGPSGASLDPPPRNLTSLEGWKRGTRISDIFRTLTLGLEGTQMSGYEYLTPAERFELTHYVQSFAQGHRADTRASLAELDEEFQLSQGAQEPNVIPISMAVDNEIAEATPVPSEPDSARDSELRSAAPRGAELFAKLVAPDERTRASYLLASDSTWVESSERFRRIVTAGVPTNGFSAAAVRLSGADWRALHRYAALRYRPDTGGG